MEFDLYSALIGAIAGLLLGALLRLKALKQLKLMLRTIGLELGIEGFESDTQGGVKIGDVHGGLTGDIAGRDINKTSNFYKNLLAATREVQSGNLGDSKVAQCSPKLELRTDNEQLVEELGQIQGSGDGWFPKYIDRCLADPELMRQLKDHLRDLRASGWNAVLIEPLDNISRGLLVSVTLRKELVTT